MDVVAKTWIPEVKSGEEIWFKKGKSNEYFKGVNLD
jgi:hypothetical protein